MRSGRKATAVTKRLTALFLAAIMTCGAVPLSVFAGEDPAPQDMVLEQPADGQNFSVSPGTDIQTGPTETDSSQMVQELSDQDPAAGGTALPSEQEPPVTEPLETPDNGSGTDNGSGSDAQGTDDTGTGEQNPSGDSGITDTPVQTGDIPEETLEEAAVKESEQENDDVSAAAFDQAAALGNASVSVRAGAGAFPAEAMLSVRTLSQEEQALADAAAAEARAAQGTDTEPAASYSYSVEILHPEGYALQPEAGIPAEIIFTLPEAADEKLTAEVYSLAFDSADGKLKAEKKDCSLNRQEQKVTIQTNTITWYTVVFVPTETNS